MPGDTAPRWRRTGQRTSATCGASFVDGRAVAPPEIPTAVKQVIAAANHIDGRPYVWGGGHAGWFSRGYDCLSAVGYALHGAGLLGVTVVSGQPASWEEARIGRWITVYANSDHVYMVVAGLRFDTRDAPTDRGQWAALAPGQRQPAQLRRAPSRRTLMQYSIRSRRSTRVFVNR